MAGDSAHARRSLGRSARELGKIQFRKLFELGQRAGVDVSPRHFYSEVPDIRWMRRTSGWRRPYTMAAVGGAELGRQLEFVRRCSSADVVSAAADVHERACQANGAKGYGPIEAQFLYCFARSHRPARIIQIGAGVSTAVLLQAAADAGYEPQLTCIDPYPTGYLKSLAGMDRIRLIEAPAQEVALEELTDVHNGDLLFVDSTHTVRPGNEVNRIVLEALPRLEPGVFVHFHDITFPYDYSPGVLDADLFFWNETALLLAFLTCNPAFEIRAAFSMLHDGASDELHAIFPDYRPEKHDRGIAQRGGEGGHFPSSAYLQRVAEP